LSTTNVSAYKLKAFYCIWYWILHRTKYWYGGSSCTPCFLSFNIF